MNIATGETWTYGYNNANELISAVDRTSTGTLIQSVAYVYDAEGNRIEEDVTAAGSTTPTVTRFAVDLNQNVWADLDGNNDLVTRYLTGDAPDQEIARISAARWRGT